MTRPTILTRPGVLDLSPDLILIDANLTGAPAAELLFQQIYG
jgi:hypothetical protein